MNTRLVLLAVAVTLAAFPGGAQPIRDVPGTEPAPVPEIAPIPGTAPPEQTERGRDGGGDAGLTPARDRSGGTTDAGLAASTPYSGVPERGDAATGASGLGR